MAEIEEKELASTNDAVNSRGSEGFFDEPPRLSFSQEGVWNLGVANSATDEPALELLPGNLNLGKLGHGRQASAADVASSAASRRSCSGRFGHSDSEERTDEPRRVFRSEVRTRRSSAVEPRTARARTLERP